MKLRLSWSLPLIENKKHKSKFKFTRAFIKELIQTYILLVIVVVPAVLIVKYLMITTSIFYGVQVFEASVVVFVNQAAGIHVVQESTDMTKLSYQPLPGSNTPFGIWIAPDCTGFIEIVFLSATIIAFRGPALRTRVFWACILSIVIFIENLIRLILNYPLAAVLGEETWLFVHDWWWHYGQLLFVLLLFGLWFWFVARIEITATKSK